MNTFHAVTVKYNSHFFSTWVFFHEHSRFTGQQGKWEAISLSPLYDLHPLHRHLGISWAITAESSPLHIASRRTRTGNLWFPSASRKPLSCAPFIMPKLLRCFLWIIIFIFHGSSLERETILKFPSLSVNAMIFTSWYHVIT